MPRQAGKLGRKPMDKSRPRLTLEKYLDPRTPLSAAGLPSVTLYQDVDRESLVKSWPMYMNDQLGCCTIAGLAHMYGAWTTYAVAAGGEALFPDSEIVTVYSRVGGYDPSQTQPDGSNLTDNGCLCSDVLADARVTGMTDVNGHTHKVAGYAAMGNPADEVLIGQLLDVFGAVYIGADIQQHMMDEFNAGQPWTWEPGDQVVGGHCIPLERRVPAGSRVGILEYITWAADQHATFGWQSGAVEEAWAVVTEDWLTVNGTTVEGLDLTQLLADMADV